ncbi:LPXTG cell wall anchor domain-containing protein [Lentzea sp. JNUCC 0626]|uniref:LPXTG cell wall anchor domain-containing protein n=1 Tax=Lentzea sp. JNUCC 0626 TaxID=3367513 RepID=UPI0037496E18
MASRVVGAFVVAATATIASLALATPASAHTAAAKAECVKEDAVLSIDLRAYVGNTNTVLVKDGTEVLVDTKFGETYTKKFVRDGSVAHTFTVVVKASDDPQYNHEGTYKTPPCVEKPPVKPSSSTPPSPSKPPVVPSTPSSVPSTPVSSSVPPPVVPAPEPPLANTGASTTWLLLSGLGLVGAGAATVLLVRRRRA